MFLRRFMALLSTRNKEFLRDRSTISWNILMPVLIILGLAFTFTGGFTDQYKIGVANNQTNAPAIRAFLKTRYIDFIKVTNIKQAIVKVKHHQLDMLLDVSGKKYWINKKSPKGYLAERIMRASVGNTFEPQKVSGRQTGYVDWVIPGILSMNIMFSSLFGVGFVIVRYRKNGMLKRLKATPVTAFEYLSAQIVSRLLLIIIITILIYYGTRILIGYAMYGSVMDLFIVFALGAINMISLGLIIAARIRSEETASGLLNLLSLPMMFLSGVWFSLDGTNPVMQKLAQVFPLTHITVAARAIMLNGADLATVSPQLLILAGESVIFLIIGSWLFRWE
ncbi:MAG: ABC transporter permease [Gammaproteobacteria bacterium]